MSPSDKNGPAWITVARRVAVRYPLHMRGDIEGAALVALSKHRPANLALATTIARRAGFDEYRAQARAQRARDHVRPSTIDAQAPMRLGDIVARLESPRHRRICIMLAAGYTQADIARRLDLTPGRVSQIVEEIRQHLT